MRKSIETTEEHGNSPWSGAVLQRVSVQAKLLLTDFLPLKAASTRRFKGFAYKGFQQRFEHKVAGATTQSGRGRGCLRGGDLVRGIAWTNLSANSLLTTPI